ncbi:MAG TPA: TAXI family TRAP transporter solute-binding subunit [Salinisphaeraceae bacterium]|nr:TAXI family TRAP transporter solute-binding subunit [Salinisphaeraceae bacterium]
MRISKWLMMAALTAIVAATGSVQAETKFINILTGGQSGVYYPMGVALSQIYNKEIEGARSTAQVTRASAENMNLLQAGRAEVAFALADTVSDAYEGVEEAGFEAPLDKLRGLSGMYNNYIQIVASKNSGIETLEDLKGKRISVGAARSGTELNARAVLGAAGISYDDFEKVEYLPFGESVELMKNRQLDVTLQSAGLGVSSIRDLSSSIDIVVVPIPRDVVEKIDSEAYQPATIPADTYDDQTEDVATAAVPNFLITASTVPDDLVYEMTKVLYENLDTLKAAHNAAEDIKLEHALDGMPVPLHPGAERYYQEVGLID